MGTRRTITALRVASIALVIAGVIGAATVGGTAKTSAAQLVATVRAAPDNIASAGTVTIKYHFSGSGNGTNIDFDGIERQDFANKRSTGELTLPGPLGTLKIVSEANTVYFQTDKTTNASGEPGWWQVNIAEGALQGGSEESVAGVPNGRDYLAYLRDVAGNVTDEGDSNIDGVTVHHYSGALDLAKVFSSASMDAQQAQLSQLEQQGVTIESKMDAFIDDDKLPRRVTITISAEGFSFEIRLDFVDYGAPIDVVVPPADQVVETRDVGSSAEFLAVSQELGRLLVGG